MIRANLLIRAKLRLWLPVLAALAAIAIWKWPAASPQPAPAAAGDVRSLLLITLDTVRADRLEPYGAKNVETPVLAQLARQGILFERAYAVAPITLVAHASLLTGAYPPEHGVRNNGTYSLAEDWTTLPEILRQHGFRTAAFVSATVLEARYGLDRGFEVYDEDLRSERTSAAAVDRPAAATVNAARRWLDQLGAGDRFFLWVHLFDPHAPYAPPEPFGERYKEQPYDGEIAYVDAEIGRLLDHPRLAGTAAAAVIVLADHGESLGEHGEDSHGMLPYDATLRIPWILRLPAAREDEVGIRSRTPVDQTDLPAMVLDVLGIAAPLAPAAPAGTAKEWAARPAPEIESDPSAEPRSLYAETYMPYLTYGWSPLRTLRRGRWKYVEAPTPELYDLERDPGESTNRIAEQPQVARQLAGELERRFGTVEEDDAAAGAADLDRETAARLRSLGYLGSAGETGKRRPAQAVDPKEAIHLHVRLEDADQALRGRRFEEAIGILRKVLEQDPENLRALSDLATAQASGGALEAGIRTLQTAVAMAPRNPQLHLQLAAFEEERARPEAALHHLDSALALHPEYLEARLEKASYLARLERFEEAAAELDAVLQRHPRHAEANALYALLVEARGGREDAAEARLRDALARDPYLAFAWRGLGELLERAGRTPEAIEAYQSGLSRRGDDGALRAALGRLLAPTGGGAETSAESLHARNEKAVERYREGDRAGAVEALTALAAEDPGYAPAHVNLAWIALEAGDWEAAERHSRRALELDPANRQAWMNLGRALESRERLAEAEAAYRQAVELVPDAWRPRLSLAVLELQRGDAAGARRELETAERLAADDAEARLRLAAVYAEGLNDREAARVHYEAFLRLAPDHPAADEVRRRLRR